MKITRTSRWATIAVLALSVGMITPPTVRAEEPDAAPPPPSREKMIAAAREMIGTLKFCALITTDEAGRPNIRTMNPFPPEDDMSVWMATTTKSRKYAEIQRNPLVALYYANHAEAAGYVVLSGRAVLVDDMQEILKRKRAYWDQAFPGLENLVLIHVIPERLEVVAYKDGLGGDPVTFAAPATLLEPATPAQNP